MSLPPGLSQGQFDNALSEFRTAVGNDWVFTIDEHIAMYKDYFSPLQNTEAQPIPSAAVAPDSVEELKVVLRVANDYQIPLWTISTGKNYGYGGPDSRVNGSVIVDLKRMNRILELNEEHAYALVEPGVSTYDLWREIRRRGYRLWTDGPSPAYASIIGNTLERGAGYGLLGERAAAQCGMEVVLANGDVMRTGMGANSNAETWQQYKYGLGPYVDGMFSQSNLGIVTKMGIWLIPEPPAFRSAEVYVSGHEDIIPMIDTLRPLRLSNVIANSATASTNQGGHIEGAQGPGGGAGGGPNVDGGHAPGLPGWRARLGFYGYDRVVEANWEQVQDEFASAIPSATFHSSRFAAPYNPDEMLTESKLAAGIPSFQEAPIWNHGGTFVSMVMPFTGADYWDFLQTYDGLYQEYGMRYMGGPLHFHAPRSLMTLAGVPLSSTDNAVNERAMALCENLIRVSGEKGWSEYRTPLVFMDNAMESFDFNDHALRRFHETLKDTLDPNGILSPGKNGVWPQRLREERA
ncbi:MAG: FAD-binding oxidoreductase [Gammaproteobacteria bacterium]|nr:FAD-binding oxidoreductase [Gammaproteobacteria bacterium]